MLIGAVNVKPPKNDNLMAIPMALLIHASTSLAVKVLNLGGNN